MFSICESFARRQRSPTSPPFSHVIVPTTNGPRKRERIRLHYSRTLTPSDVTKRKGIAVNTPDGISAQLARTGAARDLSP